MYEHWCAQQELQSTFFRSLTLHQPQQFVEVIFICGTLKRTVMQLVTLTTPIIQDSQAMPTHQLRKTDLEPR